MKKITLFLLLFATLFANAQETTTDGEKIKYPQDVGKKYELKLNAFNLIAFSSLDVTYERLLTPESSFGVSLFYNFSDFEEDEIIFTKKFSLTPYYRWFFSEKYARGFFVEGFGMLNTYEDVFNDYYNPSRVETETGFALGISVGGKFITKSGFITEVHLGIGRNLINGSNDNDFLDTNIVGRFGISLGYRF